jgi:hypothetical protein
MTFIFRHSIPVLFFLSSYFECKDYLFRFVCFVSVVCLLFLCSYCWLFSNFSIFYIYYYKENFPRKWKKKIICFVSFVLYRLFVCCFYVCYYWLFSKFSKKNYIFIRKISLGSEKKTFEIFYSFFQSSILLNFSVENLYLPDLILLSSHSLPVIFLTFLTLLAYDTGA